MDIEADQPDFEQGLNVVGTELAKPRSIPVFNLAARMDALNGRTNGHHARKYEPKSQAASRNVFTLVSI